MHESLNLFHQALIYLPMKLDGSSIKEGNGHSLWCFSRRVRLGETTARKVAGTLSLTKIIPEPFQPFLFPSSDWSCCYRHHCFSYLSLSHFLLNCKNHIVMHVHSVKKLLRTFSEFKRKLLGIFR